MGLVRAIATLTSIAPYLATNRRGRYAQERGDVLLDMPGFLQGVNLVSLILGQLVIGPHSASVRSCV